MTSDDIKKMDEIASKLTKSFSLNFVAERSAFIDEKLRQLETEQDKLFLVELDALSEEEKMQLYMILH